ncbi:PadR family transcriptional regulator [Paenibacillus sp. SAF-054]|uniref:PadR family transcriptional regulator n=1 Tax=unclassified Paenibacillus TaxID=185978 RepID=UPI003F802BF0
MNSPDEMLPLTEAFYYILIALYKSPSHGYGIMQDAEHMSGGRVRIGAGTLYTALNTLQNKGLIEPHAGPQGTDTRRKMYAITLLGRQVAQAEIIRLEELSKVGRRMISSETE